MESRQYFGPDPSDEGSVDGVRQPTRGNARSGRCDFPIAAIYQRKITHTLAGLAKTHCKQSALCSRPSTSFLRGAMMEKAQLPQPAE
jgi:hypothetical protein